MRYIKNFFIFFYIFFLLGCETFHIPIVCHYSGEYFYAYSEIILTSLTTGLSDDSAPIIDLIESDSFGRQMFLYYLPKNSKYNYLLDWNTITIFIVQHYDGEYFYYYFGQNYISAKIVPENNLSIINNKATVGNPLAGFSAEDIEQLKQKNDWNAPLKIENCRRHYKDIDPYQDISLDEYKSETLIKILKNGYEVEIASYYCDFYKTNICLNDNTLLILSLVKKGRTGNMLNYALLSNKTYDAILSNELLRIGERERGEIIYSINYEKDTQEIINSFVGQIKEKQK